MQDYFTTLTESLAEQEGRGIALEDDDEWAAILKEAELLFKKMSNRGGHSNFIDKQLLVDVHRRGADVNRDRLHRDDQKFFDSIDDDHDGNITLEEWYAW